MSALSGIATAYETVLLTHAERRCEAEQRAEEADMSDSGDEMQVPSDDEAGRKRHAKQQKQARAKRMSTLRTNPPCVSSDEGSLPANGTQVAANGNRCFGLYGEDTHLLEALEIGEGAGFSATTLSKLCDGSVWKRKCVEGPEPLLHEADPARSDAESSC